MEKLYKRINIDRTERRLRAVAHKVSVGGLLCIGNQIMFRTNPNRSTFHNILGIILLLAGGFVLFAALADFLFRLLIASLGLYLVYSGLKLRNQHSKIHFYFSRFWNGSRRFW